MHGGLRVTGINQTLIDLGAGLAPARSPGGHRLTAEDQVELALESALRLDYTSLGRLSELLDEVDVRRSGAAVLRAVLARRPPGATACESWLETRTVQVLRNDGMLDVDRQVRIYDRHGRLIGRVDLKVLIVIIECDSREFHQDFEKDRARWAALHAAGYLVLPVTFRMVEFGTPEMLRSLRDLLATAGRIAG